jgi:hypothetical protein
VSLERGKIHDNSGTLPDTGFMAHFIHPRMLAAITLQPEVAELNHLGEFRGILSTLHSQNIPAGILPAMNL